MKQIQEAYDKYAQDVYRYALFKLKDKDEALDIVGDTYAKLIQQKEKLVNIQNMRLWLIGIARNIIYHKFRDLARQADIPDEGFDSLADESQNVERESLSAELIALVGDLLGRLDELSKEVVILRIWEELKFEEIASMIGEKASTVKLRYYRSLEKLRQAAAENGESRDVRSLTLPIIIFAIEQLGVTAEYSWTSDMANKLKQSLSFNQQEMAENLQKNSWTWLTRSKRGVLLLGLGLLVVLVSGGTIVYLAMQANKPAVEDGLEEEPEVVTSVSLYSSASATTTATVASTVSVTSSASAPTAYTYVDDNCKLSFDLPIQGDYSSPAYLLPDSVPTPDMAYRWGVYTGTGYTGAQYSRGAFHFAPCGPGCIQEANVHIQCPASTLSTDQLAENYIAENLYGGVVKANNTVQLGKQMVRYVEIESMAPDSPGGHYFFGNGSMGYQVSVRDNSPDGATSLQALLNSLQLGL